MSVKYRGGDAVAAVSTVASVNLTIPGSVQPGDYMCIFTAANPVSGDTITPSGWTRIGLSNFSGTMTAYLYEKIATADDANATVNIANPELQRLGAVLGCYYSTKGRNISALLNNSAGSTSTPAAATATSTEDGVAVACIVERSSSPSTVFTPPSGFTLRQSAFGIGSGSVSAGLADDLDLEPAGSIGGGSWGSSSNVGFVTAVIGLTDDSKIPVFLELSGEDDVEVSWEHPDDAPNGVTIVRAPGTHINDGDSNTPDDPEYDPLTIDGAAIITEGEESSPYLDEGLSPGTYTYWVVRTGEGE